MARLTDEEFAEKDQLVRNLGEFVSPDGKTMVAVGIYRFNGGPPKIGISRSYENRDGTVKPAKLGRLTLEEAKKVHALLGAAIEAFPK
jgi:hypothetical protein